MSALARLFAALLLVTFLGGCSVTVRPDLAPSVPTYSVQPLQMNGSNFCTAFSVNEAQGYWMTAAHCVDAASMMQTMLGGQMSLAGYPATVVYRDDYWDMAVVQSYFKAPALRLAPAAVRPGARITIIGFPYGVSQHVTVEGYLAARNLPIEDKHPSDVLDATVAGGNSGSPVLSGGYVVGVLWGRFIDSEHALGVPYEALKNVEYFWR